MKKTLLLLAITFAIISCNKPAEVRPIHKNLLLKINDINNALIFNFEYDSQNRLVNMARNSNAYNPTLDLIFTYNTNGTLNEFFSRNTDKKNRMIYNQDGTLKGKEEYESYGGKESVINKYTYTYSNGKVTENYVQPATSAGWKQIYSYDSKNNLTEIQVYSKIDAANPNGTDSGKIYYGNYDSKNHYYSNMPAAFYFPNKYTNNYGYVQYGETNGKYKFTYEY